MVLFNLATILLKGEWFLGGVLLLLAHFSKNLQKLTFQRRFERWL